MLDVPSPLSTSTYAPVITKRSCAYVPAGTTALETSEAVVPASVKRSVVTAVFMSTVLPWLPCKSISEMVTTAAFTSPGASVSNTESFAGPADEVVSPPHDAIVPNAKKPIAAADQRAPRVDRKCIMVSSGFTGMRRYRRLRRFAVTAGVSCAVSGDAGRRAVAHPAPVGGARVVARLVLHLARRHGGIVQRLGGKRFEVGVRSARGDARLHAL